MRVGVVLFRVALVVVFAVAVASPSFVDRRGPTFVELFERFRASDMTIAYRESFSADPAWTRNVMLAKSGHSHLRIDLTYPSLRVDARPGEEDRSLILLTPASATYCSSGISGRRSSLPYCFPTRPEDRDYWQQQAGRLLMLPLALSGGSIVGDNQSLSWTRQEDREVLGMWSSCFRATPPDAGAFMLCLTDRGDLLYASVGVRHGTTAIEAMSVEPSVDMSVFDENKLASEN